MVHAYIMTRTAAGASAETLGAIRQFDNVSEAHVVAGDFDIIAEVDAADVYAILHVASAEIQSLEGIIDTRTYVSLD